MFCLLALYLTKGNTRHVQETGQQGKLGFWCFSPKNVHIFTYHMFLWYFSDAVGQIQ